MISNDGKLHIKRFLAGWSPAIGRSIAYGIGGKVEAVTDSRLHFEVGRTDVSLTSYDFVNNKVVFKTQIPIDFEGTIYEVGLFSAESNEAAGASGSKLLLTFDSDSEDWVDTSTLADATYVAANSRVGINSLRLSGAASSTTGVKLSQLNMDLSAYSGADKFLFAYQAFANVNNIHLRFHSATSDYFQFATGAPSVGYNIAEFNKADATASGSPSWDAITEVRVYMFATAGGSATVDLDAVRVDDTDTINPDYAMVARELLTTPVFKQAGKVLEVEFGLGVTL